MNANHHSVILAISLFFALSASISAAQGNLDPAFGNGGKVITDFNPVDYANAVALQPDGKLIVAGATNPPAPADFLIVRYNGNGSLDTSFGNGGKVVSDFGASDSAHAVALQPDGKIVAAGASQSSSIGNIVLARYNADGSLDSTFGNGGKITTDINGQYERADALVLQADGKLVTAGFICGGGNCDVLLIRYNSNGGLDSTFGSGGIVTTDYNGQGVDSARALVLQPDGKIVAAGSVYLSAKSDFALARYNSNGTLDTTFGAGGIVTTDFGDSEDASDVVIQPDGKIVAAGSFGDGDPDNDPSKFALARYNADGTLDTTFGSGGKVLTDLGQSGHFIGLSGLALQAGGKIVVAGGVRLFNENFASVSENFALVRYNTSGTLDTTFGAGGIVTTNFGVFVRAAGGIVIQPDGKVVAAGYTVHENNSSDIALARYVLDTPCPISIDCTEFFVRQHYLDFLSREPDDAGLAFWTNEITSCGTDVGCREGKRINVSAAFFLSIEFQQTGYLVYRTYKAAYGDATSQNVPGTVPVVRLNEFLPETQQIGQGVRVGIGDWQQQLEANKNAYALDFVRRQRFRDAYSPAMSAAEFIDALNARAGGVLSPSERDQLVTELAANDTEAGRAVALRKVAEDEDLRRAEFNRAFVLMQYYGYLRRNPNDPPDVDFSGWKFWLDKLNQFNGNFVEAEMVQAFLASGEYRGRFGNP